jgi:hypothetical protein
VALEIPSSAAGADRTLKPADTFRMELSEQDKIPAAKAMLEAAKSTVNDPPAKAALYLPAAEAAAKSGDTKLAFSALEQLGAATSKRLSGSTSKKQPRRPPRAENKLDDSARASQATDFRIRRSRTGAGRAYSSDIRAVFTSLCACRSPAAGLKAGKLGNYRIKRLRVASDAGFVRPA